MFGPMGLTLGFTVMIGGGSGGFMMPDLSAKALLGSSINFMFRATIFW